MRDISCKKKRNEKFIKLRKENSITNSISLQKPMIARNLNKLAIQRLKRRFLNSKNKQARKIKIKQRAVISH